MKSEKTCCDEPHLVRDLGEDIELEITCKSVYLTPDEGWGLAFNHEEFEEIMENYENHVK